MSEMSARDRVVQILDGEGRPDREARFQGEALDLGRRTPELSCPDDSGMADRHARVQLVDGAAQLVDLGEGGGASQLALVTVAGSASLWALCVAVLVINSRHIMYSAALASAFREQPRWFRWLAPWFLVDQIFALASVRPSHDPDSFRGYYLSCAVVFFGVGVELGDTGHMFGRLQADAQVLADHTQQAAQFFLEDGRGHFRAFDKVECAAAGISDLDQ